MTAAVVIGGLQLTPPGGDAPPQPTASPPLLGLPSIAADPAALVSPAAVTCAQRAYASMTLPQVIGQLFALALPGNALTPAVAAAIADYHVGSVWFSVKSTAGIAPLRATSDAVQALATSSATANVRFLVGANQEGGLIQALAGPGFSTIPSALAQGTLSPATLAARARVWGLQLKAAGVNLDFAPVADTVPYAMRSTNAPIGALHREYGYYPAPVRSHVVAFIQGMTQAGVATTAKHFPGLGRVVGNTDFVASVRDWTTTSTDPYLAPFAGAVAANVPFVMVSLATYERIDPSHLAVFSRQIIGGILRTRLGFQGVVMSDALDAAAVSTMPARSRAIDFISAGGNMLVVSTSATAVAMAQALLAQATSDPWFHRLVDNAAVRVLRAKASLGLVPCA